MIMSKTVAKTIIEAKNIEVTEALRNITLEKLEKVTNILIALLRIMI